MAGNSQRRGARRKSGSKKGATVGSGGQRRKALEPKGPTPRAKDRVGHPASRRSSAQRSERSPQPRPATSVGQVVAGRNPVLEVLRSGAPARSLTVMSGVDHDGRIVEILDEAHRRGLAVSHLSRADLDAKSGGLNHQGVLLHTEPFRYHDLDELLGNPTEEDRASTSGDQGVWPPVVVVLDGIVDPHNVGAIGRSALAFGSRGMIIPKRRSAAVNATAWRTSAGAFARLPVAEATNLTRAITDCQARGYFVVGLAGDAQQTVEQAAQHFHDVPLVVVVGSEGEGLSRIVADHCDVTVSIDMPGGFESLNASVAAGIALYEITRHRQR